MFWKKNKKIIVKACVWLAGVSTSCVVLSSPSLANINNISVLSKAMGQTRDYIFYFTHTRVNATTDSIIKPFISRFKSFEWKRLLGKESRPWYGRAFFPLFYSDSSSNSDLIMKNGTTFDYMWSNYDVYGFPSKGKSYIKNYLNVSQYNSVTSERILNYTPRFQYSGEEPFDSWANKTQAYIMDYPAKYSISTDNPVVITMSKNIQHNTSLLYNNTNWNEAKIYSYSQGVQDWFPGHQLGFENNSLGYFLQGKDNNSKDAKDTYNSAYSTFIVSREYGTTGYNNIYSLSGNTKVRFEIKESNLPPESERGDILAINWASDLYKSKKILADFYGENAIPATFYSLSGEMQASNINGYIEFRIRPGILFDKRQIFADDSGFKYPKWLYEYVARVPDEITFRCKGFKKIKPTELIKNINVNNPYIQPQYVTVDEIKKIILEKGIKGSTPCGFTTDNIFFTDIKRYNTTGTIKAKTYLNLYFDQIGHIQETGFTPIEITIEGWAKTNFSVLPNSISVKNLGLGNVLPTDVSIDMIKDIIYDDIVKNKLIWKPGINNENACFPQNFSKDDLIIKNGSVLADNLLGNIRVDIMVDNFFNDKGEISSYQVSLGRVTIKDFKRVQATILANNAYDYIDPSNELYPTDVAANLVLLKNFIGFQIPDFMKPSNFFPDRDVQLSNVVANNKDGTIYATVSLNNYYDSRGIVRQTGFVPKEIIFNFNTSISETHLPIEIDVSSTHNEILAHDITEEDIKKIIYDNILLGRPKDFTTNNIKFDVLPNWESSKGRITVTPILDYWVDENGYFRTDPKKFPNLTIYGFSGSPITSFNKKILQTAGLPAWIPSSVAKHQDLLKDIILKGISGKPIDFSPNNIEIISTTPNNIDGILDVELILNYYNDANGNPQTSGFKPVTISIGGFGTAEMPTSIIGYILGDSERIAQSYTQKELKDLIIENINFPVDGMDQTNISFKNVDYDYINGRISFTPVLNLWFGDDLAIHTEPKDFPTVTIGNLKTVKPTIINKSSLNIGNPDIVASEFAEEYTNNLLPLVDTIIENKPDSWNLNTSLELKNIIHNDFRGEIQMDVILNNFYNSEGILKSEGFVPETIVITGFKKITGPTSINSEIDLTGFENVYPFEVTQTQIKQLIFENLQNKVPGMSIHNISLYGSLEIDNFGGVIKVKPAVNAYYDENGDIILNTVQLNEVTFRNFKKTPGTTILSTNKLKGDPNILASEAAKDISKFKQMVFENLVNIPPNFIVESDIEISNLFYDNILATVSFDVIIKKIYDKKGTIISGEFNFGNIMIDGYFAASGYTSIPGRIQSPTPDLYASDIKEEDLRKIILQNVKNPPVQLTINEILIKENSILIDNRLGIIKFIPILNWTYDIYGGLVNIPKEFEQITIFGYKKSSQTTIPTTTISANRFPEIANLYPNELASNLQLLKELSFKLVDSNTTPTGFNVDNVQIDSIYADNYTGSINFDIKLNYFFNENGVVQTTNFQPVTITIVDMQASKGLTSILRIINSNERFKTPESITDDEIKQLILNNASNLPPNFTKDDILFKVEPNRNNLTGSIKVIPILKKSYNINSDLVTTPIEFNEITINGFLTTSQTTLLNNEIYYENTNTLPSILAKDIVTLKQLVKNNLTSTPVNFSLDNIIIKESNIIYDNILGKLTFGFTLNNYYNEKGLLVTSESDIYWLTINKLLSISKTVPTADEFILPGVQTTLPSDFSDKKVIEYVKTNISSVLFNYIPENFDVDTDLEVFVRERDNVNGSMSVIIRLKQYYNSSGELIIANSTNEYATFVLNFKGFNVAKPTTFVDEILLYNQESVLAQTVAFNKSLMSDIIIKNISGLTTNIPANFSLSDIVLKNDFAKDFNNKEGTLTIELGIKNYYDKNGNHIIVESNSDNILKGIIKLKGFMINTGTTIIPKFNVSNYENRLPSSITTSDISTIILNNYKNIFSSLPSAGSLSGNIDVRILSADNQKGEIIAKISLYEYFDKNGNKINKQDNIPLVQNVVFSGFSSLSPTYISNEFFVKDQRNNLATTVTEEQLKILLYANLSNLVINLPNDFSIDNNLTINILEANNITGEIFINVSLNYYINDNGVIVNASNETETLNKNVVIKGFKKVKQTLIAPEVFVKGYGLTSPHAITNDELKNIVKDNLHHFFINLPDNFTHDELLVNILSANEKTGTIYAKITLTTYYDINESLIIDGSLTQVVRIDGFRSIRTSGSSVATLIAVSITAGILTVAFAIGLLVSLKIAKKKIKL